MSKTVYQKVSIPDLVKQRMHNPPFIAMIGLMGSGKSTVGALLEKLGYRRLNGDNLRAELFPNGQPVDEALVFKTIEDRLVAALVANQKVVLDLTNLTPRSRNQYVKVAREHRVQTHYLLLDETLETCLLRNSQRDRFVPEDVIVSASQTIRRKGLPDCADGSKITIIRSTNEPGIYLLIPKQETPNLLRAGGEPLPGSEFDIIGDVHGCYDELRQLLTRLGYDLSEVPATNGMPLSLDREVVKARAPRKLVFVGDLTDRGPASDMVLALVMELVRSEVAHVVKGNHCDKLLRVLKGNPIKPKPDLQQTIQAIKKHRPQFRPAVLNFLLGLPVRLENSQLIVVHAAYRQGLSPAYAEKLAMIGEVDGSRDEHGFPIRLENWEREYTGGKTIVHGHVPVREVVDRQYPGGRVINVDTSCCFGGKLTALRFPEYELVQVPALREYAHRHGSEEE